MPRTKGSKNKPKATNDFSSQITEKKESIVSLTSEITSITANIDTLKADLKEKKTALKAAQKELTKLEAKKAAAEAKAAEAAKKVEAETVLKKLLASGMTADEILEKLKYSNMPCVRLLVEHLNTRLLLLLEILIHDANIALDDAYYLIRYVSIHICIVCFSFLKYGHWLSCPYALAGILSRCLLLTTER